MLKSVLLQGADNCSQLLQPICRSTGQAQRHQNFQSSDQKKREKRDRPLKIRKKLRTSGVGERASV